MTFGFYKMQGAGNDYIFFDAFCADPGNPAAFAERLCDRRFGIGADGVIVLRPARGADAFMEMYNSDGSRGSMCGNGIRCAAVLLLRLSRLKGQKAVIATDAGLRTVVPSDEPCADMGRAEIVSLGLPVPAGLCAAVYMGNPHMTVFLRGIAALDTESAAARILPLSPFEDGANVGFAHINERGVELRVYERGSGETLSCGTGACAAVVAGAALGLLKYDRAVSVFMRGGVLTVGRLEGGNIYLKGPVKLTFTGLVEI